MERSILVSIKKLLGIGEDYDQFDKDITMHINSVLSSLRQVGIGPTGFMVTSEKETWDDLIGENDDQEMVISYVYLKVRLLFDPPANSVMVQTINDSIKEFEWRLSISSESKKKGA